MLQSEPEKGSDHKATCTRPPGSEDRLTQSGGVSRVGEEADSEDGL